MRPVRRSAVPPASPSVLGVLLVLVVGVGLPLLAVVALIHHVAAR